MPAKLSAQNVFFTYSDGLEALRNISLDIHEHELFVLFGPARSGKTTLLQQIIRQYPNRKIIYLVNEMASIDIDGKRYWFDAIAPTGGEGADAVPQLEYGRPVASRVPQEQIILRIISALAAKQAKWQKDLAVGRVSDKDGFIVAMNDRSIRWAWLGAEMPYVAKGLYGFGNLTVSFDVRTLKAIETKHEHRPKIAKASGTGISSQPFAVGECPEVSAVLYSSVDAANFPGVLGADFSILHNFNPNVPLPLSAQRFYREYWIAGESLNVKDWSQALEEES